MPRLLAAALTVALAAVLAVGAALGVVALLEATPDQPNTPLITYEQAYQGVDRGRHPLHGLARRHPVGLA